jgi:Rho termination factor, N-terminal domain
MPPRGVKKGTKRARQYEHIKESAKDRGTSESRAEEIAARTVNKERARSGESRTASKSSKRGPSPSRKGGKIGGRASGNGSSPTKEELYKRAKQLGIEGRSSMSKQQLARAVGRKA